MSKNRLAENISIWRGDIRLVTCVVLIALLAVLATGGTTGVQKAYAACPEDCDNDGYNNESYGGTDCDDNDNAVWQLLTGYTDVDDDGYGDASEVTPTQVCSGYTLPPGWADNNDDCNDWDPDDHPPYYEITCNGIDENCNGMADDNPDGDGDTVGVCDDDCNDADNTVWQSLPGYTDGDDDGYGTGSEQQVCSGATLPAGYSLTNDDCDDTNEFVNPDADEVCNNSKDDDCDGDKDCADSDCLIDADSDTYYSNANGCGDDCDDSNEFVNPNAVEICNDTIDNDCDGDVDCADSDCLIDDDGDTYYDENDPYCPGDDCDDSDENNYPGNTENCGDGQDNDCDGDVDMLDDDCDLTGQKEITSTGVYNFGGQVNATVNCTALATPGAITITVHPGQFHSHATGDSVQRWFEINSTASGTFTLTLSYLDSELGEEVEGNLKLWRYDGGWDGPYPGIIDGALNTITVEDVSNFSDWIISDAGPQPPVMEWTTILLIAVGILTLGGFVWYRRYRMPVVSA